MWRTTMNIKQVLMFWAYFHKGNHILVVEGDACYTNHGKGIDKNNYAAKIKQLYKNEDDIYVFETINSYYPRPLLELDVSHIKVYREVDTYNIYLQGDDVPDFVRADQPFGAPDL